METIYIPDSEFKSFIDSHESDVMSEDGHMRWVCVIDGMKKIVIPESVQ